MVSAEGASIACASPEEISILEIGFLVRACNGLDKLFGTEGGAQQDRLIGGTQPIAQKVAQRLGNAILLGKPVRRIQWTEQQAVVHSDDISVEARHVIVCTPPHLAGAIEYDPSPPTDRSGITSVTARGLRSRCR
jgi:monoamine oxidase